MKNGVNSLNDCNSVQIYIKTNPSLRDDRYSGNNLYMEKLDKVSNDFKAFVLTQHDNQKADKKADQKEKTKSSEYVTPHILLSFLFN